MTQKHIFILNGHPAEKSLNKTLAESYAAAAKNSGHEVRLTHLHDLDFDPDFGFGGYGQVKPLEPALEAVLSDLEWSEHFVLNLPLWWGGAPAKLKGLFDRALLPGRTFDTKNPHISGLPAPMLTGRTGHVFITSDTPSWFLRWIYHNPIIHQLGKQTLGFIGIKPARFTLFPGASHPKPGKVETWISKTKAYGSKGV